MVFTVNNASHVEQLSPATMITVQLHTHEGQIISLMEGKL